MVQQGTVWHMSVHNGPVSLSLTLYVCVSVDNRQQLNRTCDSLVNNEVTREEVLAQSEYEVHSTTEDNYINPNPMKKPKLTTKAGVPFSTKKSKAIEKKRLALARAEMAEPSAHVCL